MAIFDVTASPYSATGDGSTDDTTAIQSALNALANAGGGTLLIPKGTYMISSSLEIKPPGNIIISAYNATIKRTSGAGSTMYGLIQNFVPEGQSGETTYSGYTGPGNIVIEGGTWDVNGRSGGNTNKCNGINIAHSSNLTIRDVTVLDVRGWHAIEVNSTESALVENCTFKGFNDDSGTRQYSGAVQIDYPSAATMASKSYDNTFCKNVVVTGCRAIESADNGSFGRFVETHSSVSGYAHEHLKVTNNYARNLMEYAILGQCWRNTVISGNTFEHCNGGLKLETPSGMSAFGGKLPTHNVAVDSNVFEDMGQLNGYTGGTAYTVVAMYGLSSVNIQNVVVSNNVIRKFANSNGIFLSYGYAVKIHGNTITENSSSSQGYGHGIVCDVSWNTSIVNNTVTNMNDRGIIVKGSSDYSQVSNNMCHWNGGAGIYVEESDLCIVNSNSVSDNGTNYGNGSGAWGSIYINTNSLNCTVSGNNFNKGASATTTNYGLAVGTGATVHWIGNHFKGWTQANSMNGSGTAYPSNTNGFNTTYYPNRWV